VMPGAGAGAQMGMKLANRAIGQMGKYAAIGIGGLMETFLPAGSERAGKGWLPKLAGGVAGAGAALPNMAGAMAPPAPNNPAANAQSAAGKVGGDTNISVTTQKEREIGEDVAWHQTAVNAPVGVR